MNGRLVLCLLALVAMPMAYAHDPAGTPKTYCENDHAEWGIHDYGPPATGSFIALQQDGNLAGDCDGSGLSVDPNSIVVCVGINPVDPLQSFLGLCDADIGLPTADFDGHSEFALGGAWLLVDSGAGVPSTDPSVPAGTLYCFGEEGHHPAFGPFAVQDVVLGDGASFSVYADTEDLTGTGAGCGDFESDFGADCLGSCFVTFTAGLDGSYQVYVTGSQGHITNGINPCVDLVHTYSLAPGGATGEARHPSCNAVQVTNAGPGTVTLVFGPSGRTCGPVPAGGSTTCPWLGDAAFSLVSGPPGASGTWTQVP